jgi:hypothetical protein
MTIRLTGKDLINVARDNSTLKAYRLAILSGYVTLEDKPDYDSYHAALCLALQEVDTDLIAAQNKLAFKAEAEQPEELFIQQALGIKSKGKKAKVAEASVSVAELKYVIRQDGRVIIPKVIIDYLQYSPTEEVHLQLTRLN